MRESWLRCWPARTEPAQKVAGRNSGRRMFGGVSPCFCQALLRSISFFAGGILGERDLVLRGSQRRSVPGWIREPFVNPLFEMPAPAAFVLEPGVLRGACEAPSVSSLAATGGAETPWGTPPLVTEQTFYGGRYETPTGRAGEAFSAGLGKSVTHSGCSAHGRVAVGDVGAGEGSGQLRQPP